MAIPPPREAGSTDPSAPRQHAAPPSPPRRPDGRSALLVLIAVVLINVLPVVQALEERSRPRVATLLLSLVFTATVVRVVVLYREARGPLVRDPIFLVGVVLTVATAGWFGQATNQSPGPPSPTTLTTLPATSVAPPSTAPPSTLPLGERLQQLLPAVEDLPAGFVPIRVPAGARHLSDDEFCESKPSGREVLEERTKVFAAPMGLTSRRALFVTTAAFSPGEAGRFLDQVERLARLCRQWSYQPAPGHPRQITRVLSVDTPTGYGEQAVRVRLADPQGTSDFLYVRAGDLIGLVSYVVPGEADPVVVEDVGLDLARRLTQAATP